jgi:hypothetical protein
LPDFSDCARPLLKKFPELFIANIAQLLSEYCTTTFISTTNCGLLGFLPFYFPTFCPTYVEYLPDFSTFQSVWGGSCPPCPYAYVHNKAAIKEKLNGQAI